MIKKLIKGILFTIFTVLIPINMTALAGGYIVNQNGAWMNDGVVQVKNIAEISALTEVKLEDLPDKDSFLARLEIICNGADITEYNSADSSQYIYALEWVVNSTRGIIPWNNDESLSFEKGETFETKEQDKDPLINALLNIGSYYRVYNENSVHWVLKYILNMDPSYKDGVINDWIVYQNGKYYVGCIDVGYMKPPISVTSIYSDGTNYYVTFDWQRIWPWNNSVTANTQYAILRQNHTDIGPIWSIVQTSSKPIFKNVLESNLVSVKPSIIDIQVINNVLNSPIVTKQYGRMIITLSDGTVLTQDYPPSDGCAWYIDVNTGDVTGDGEEEIIVNCKVYGSTFNATNIFIYQIKDGQLKNHSKIEGLYSDARSNGSDLEASYMCWGDSGKYFDPRILHWNGSDWVQMPGGLGDYSEARILPRNGNTWIGDFSRFE